MVPNSPHRIVASLKLPLNVSALVTVARNIVEGMTGNPAFPNPAPTLAQVSASITALGTAETATLTRVKGSVATRNTARATLRTQLEQLKSYVQTVADADPEHAAALIQGAGMAVRKTPVRPPRVFDATPGPVAGSVKLVAGAAARRAAYEWEFSTDGGKTWVAAPPTLQAKTIVTGLPSGVIVQFRHRAVIKAGAQDWSTVVAVAVK